MLCSHVISFYIMSCIMAYIMRYIMKYIMLYHVISCCIILLSYYIILYHVIICYIYIYISVDLHCIAIPQFCFFFPMWPMRLSWSKTPLHIRLQKSSQQPITAFSLLRADIRLHPGSDQRPCAQRCKDTASRPLTWQEIQERSQNGGCGKIGKIMENPI